MKKKKEKRVLYQSINGPAITKKPLTQRKNILRQKE